LLRFRAYSAKVPVQGYAQSDYRGGQERYNETAACAVVRVIDARCPQDNDNDDNGNGDGMDKGGFGFVIKPQGCGVYDKGKRGKGRWGGKNPGHLISFNLF
jgi:hypothetical protein